AGPIPAITRISAAFRARARFGVGVRLAAQGAAVAVLALVAAGPAAASDPFFVRAFGKSVNSSDSSDVCTTSCGTGTSGGGSAELDSPSGVAVAGASDAYVGDFNNNRIDEFS